MKQGVIIQVSTDELKQIIGDEMQNVVKNTRDIAAEAAYNAMVQAGIVTEMLTKNEAYTLYGRATVDRWIRDGYLRAYSDVNKGRARIRRSELHRVARQFNVDMKKVATS